MIPRYAVITTYERPDICLEAVYSCVEADTVLVIDNGMNKVMPEPGDDATCAPYYLLRDDTQPVNLSNLWNQGLDWVELDARRMGYEQWDVAILNDDVLVPPGWFVDLQTQMRAINAAAGCSGNSLHVLHDPVPVPLHMRMTGWAFMLRGELGLRADEQFTWWFGDSDLDWMARLAGGMLMVGSGEVPNRFANGYTTGERQVQAADDAFRFIEKWGRNAW